MHSLGTASNILSLFLLASLIFVAHPITTQAFDVQAPMTGYTGDAFADLVVGVPGQDIPNPPSSINAAGMIHVIYGFPMGLNPQGNQTFHQDMDFVEDQAEEDDQMGSALASGDFNGDGNYDIAIGIPFEDILFGETTQVNAGAVHVFYGSDTGGISVAVDQFWNQASPNVEGSAEYNDQFGKALAVGNFNGDDYDDLAIGIPYEDFESSPPTIENAGSVIVIYGSASGLSPTAVLNDQMWYQGNGIADSVEDYDWFGFALTAGDFDSDNYDDLAIGAPGEDSEAASKDDIGVVHVLYGTASGLSAVGNQQWEQYDWGGSAESEANDHFGWSLAAGDFKVIGYDDLAIGVPDENIEGPPNVTDAGAVNILYGSASGLSDSVVDFLYQDGGYIEEDAEYLDQFGYSLAAVDFGGSGIDDLAVGVPNENLGDPLVTDAGAVHVILYSSLHWFGNGLRYFHQGRASIPDELETGDKFGYSLAPGDFNGDGKEDLAIGVPYDSCNVSGDGSVVVIYDDVWGASADYAPQRWCQGGSLVDQGEANDHFGLALAALPSTGAVPNRVYLPICMRDD